MNSLDALRKVVSESKSKKELVGDLVRDLKPGWLLPMLLEIDAHTWGRLGDTHGTRQHRR
jgi:hypothetical protein